MSCRSVVKQQALDVNLPPGLVGEPGAVPKCTREQFDNGAEGKCPADTAIGVDEATVAGPSGVFTVYNLVPPPGVAAQFGFNFNGTHTFLDAKVRSGGDYGITEHVNVPQLKVLFNTITIWGVPGEHGTGAPSKLVLDVADIVRYATVVQRGISWVLAGPGSDTGTAASLSVA